MVLPVHVVTLTPQYECPESQVAHSELDAWVEQPVMLIAKKYENKIIQIFQSGVILRP